MSKVIRRQATESRSHKLSLKQSVKRQLLLYRQWHQILVCCRRDMVRCQWHQVLTYSSLDLGCCRQGHITSSKFHLHSCSGYRMRTLRSLIRSSLSHIRTQQHRTRICLYLHEYLDAHWRLGFYRRTSAQTRGRSLKRESDAVPG